MSEPLDLVGVKRQHWDDRGQCRKCMDPWPCDAIRLAEQVAEYERCITWHVTCSGCADSLDKSIEAYQSEECEQLRSQLLAERARTREVLQNFAANGAQPTMKDTAAHAIATKLGIDLGEGK